MCEGNNAHRNGIELLCLAAVKHNPIDLRDDQVLMSPNSRLCLPSFWMSPSCFAFIGFRAVRFPRDGEKKRERFWSISSRTTIPSLMTGFAYDELLIGEDRWFTEVGGQVRKYEPDPNRPFDYDFIHMEPRVSVLCSAAAISSGMAAEPRAYANKINQQTLLKASETLEGVEAIFTDGKLYWHHVLFDRSQGYMPTRRIVTDLGEDRDNDDGNAKAMNHVRWKRNQHGNWLPDRGENIGFFGKTQAAHETFLRITYRVVWIDLDELPEEIFTKEDLSSQPGIRRTAAEQWIKAAEAIEE